MSRRHYIPIWLLKQLCPKAPWSLDTTTGEIIDLGFKKTGQEKDLWSKEIEDEIMSPHDSRAARIFHDKIKGRQRVRLSDSERLDFAKWLSLFAYRVPDAYAFVERRWEEMKADKVKLSHHYSSERKKILAELEHDYPSLYNEVIEANGKERGEQILFDDLMEVVAEHGEKLLPTSKNVWHHNIQNSMLDRDAEYISGYHWTWIYCRHELVIGDNPLVRWHVKENRSYRHINRAGVEITFPLGSNLCLYIQRTRRGDNGRRQIATKAQCEEFNRRQLDACITFVYAGERRVLDKLVTAHGKG